VGFGGLSQLQKEGEAQLRDVISGLAWNSNSEHDTVNAEDMVN